jgi:hypothetical protein
MTDGYKEGRIENPRAADLFWFLFFLINLLSKFFSDTEKEIFNVGRDVVETADKSHNIVLLAITSN